MRSTANLALWSFASLVAGGPVVGSTLVASLQETSEHSITKFQAVYSNLENGSHANFPLELRVRKSRITCDGKGIYLNGDDLAHTWDGASGHGFGTISSVSDGSNAAMSATWESVCMRLSDSETEDFVSQLLTIHIGQVGDLNLGTNLVFTVSLLEGSQPRIYDLSSPPWKLITPQCGDDWKEPTDTHCSDTPPTPVSGEDPQPEDNIEALWNQLQILKATATTLNQQIEREEAKIRQILQQSCPSSSTKWEDCTTISCRFKATFSQLPELFRQMRLRFGSLSSPLPDGFCPQCPHHSQCKQYNSSPQDDISNAAMQPSPTPTPDASNYLPDTFLEHETLTLFYVGALVTLLGSLFLLTLMICRNTMHCRRRRADFAARREERKTRRAYRFAAHRFRWQQWWNGLLTQDFSSSSHQQQDHSQRQQLSEFPSTEPAELSQTSQSEYEFSEYTPPQHGIIQAEIWGFRQALDYVGELVRNPAQDVESAYAHTREADGEIAELLNKRRIQTPLATAPSSTAGLSTAMSPRTSSLLSFDTPSIVTLDTLETADTMGPPPSYHP